MSRTVIATILCLSTTLAGVALLYGQEPNEIANPALPYRGRSPELAPRFRARVPAEVYGVTDIVTQGLNDPSPGPLERAPVRIEAMNRKGKQAGGKSIWLQLSGVDAAGERKKNSVIMLKLEDESDVRQFIKLIEQLSKQDETGGTQAESADRPPHRGRLMFGIGVNSDAGVAGEIILDETNFDVGLAGKTSPELKRSVDELRDRILLLRKDVAALRELLEKKP